jgi:hypothetical protein
VAGRTRLVLNDVIVATSSGVAVSWSTGLVHSDVIVATSAGLVVGCTGLSEAGGTGLVHNDVMLTTSSGVAMSWSTGLVHSDVIVATSAGLVVGYTGLSDVIVANSAAVAVDRGTGLVINANSASVVPLRPHPMSLLPEVFPFAALSGTGLSALADVSLIVHAALSGKDLSLLASVSLIVNNEILRWAYDLTPWRCPSSDSALTVFKYRASVRLKPVWVSDLYPVTDGKPSCFLGGDSCFCSFCSVCSFFFVSCRFKAIDDFCLLYL